MIKLSDFVAQRLKEKYGILHVFLITGGGAMHLNNSFGRYFEYTCNHNEQASAIAAEGYARCCQKLAVVNVTTGPGGLNCLNGVFGQWTDSVPVLYISGQVKTSTTMHSCPHINLRQLGDQEVDIISIVKPITKYAVSVTDPKDIQYHLDRAVYEATTGRKGPVWLDISMNVQGAMIDETDLLEFYPEHSAVKSDVDVSDVVEKLNVAIRPLIVCGHGVRLSQMDGKFRALLEKVNIPVVTTLNGFDILEDDHPNYIGRIGTIGQRAGNFALQNADCILFLGTRNNIRQISYNWENFAPKAFKIVVDIDEAELQKTTIKPDLAICADLADFLPAFSGQIGDLSREEWLDWCKKRKKKYSPANVTLDSFTHAEAVQASQTHLAYNSEGREAENGSGVTLAENAHVANIYHFFCKFSDCLRESDICVMANASPTICIYQTVKVKKNQRFITNSGNASMGYDLPAAIGACIANGRKDVICIAGDGSIMMNLQELQTIKDNNLPIKIFVLNNGGYASIKQTQNNFFHGEYVGVGKDNGVGMPDFTKISEAFGIKSVKLSNPEAIEDTIKQVLSTEGSVLCEVVIDPDYIFIPKLSSRILEDGTMVSASLEDMFPFLDREELAENMIEE
ncbi:acetolactate synthase [Alphaproteobacteria bacterium]|nr:acetolactate synthase [Alphaproteobacteria bacterium]